MPYLGKEPARVPVTAADIPDDSITAAKILDGAITVEDIGANAVDTSELVDDAVTEDKLADAINTAIAANTAKVTNATHTGDVTGATTLTIATDAVDIAMLSASGTASSSTFLRGDNSWVTPTDTTYSIQDGELSQINFTSADNTKLDAISGTNTGDQTITLTGNVTGSGTGSFAATIADDAVTYAKIQNVTATDKILGRDSAGAGVVEEISPASLRTMINVEDGATADQTQSEINALGITATGLSGTPNVSVGNITTSGYIRGPASFTIDPETHGDDTGTLVIAGNLQVDGTTTTINSTTVAIDDLNFSIATDAADSAAANGAGITIGGAGATLNYTHATTSWDMNKPLNVTGNIGVSGTVDGVDIQTLNTTAGAALPKAGGTMTGQILAPAGSAAAPSYAFSAQSSTGMYKPGTNQLYFSVGGTRKIRVESTQIVLEDDVSVNNTLTVAGDLTVDTNTLFVDASENKVGIGTTSPAHNLDISPASGNAELKVSGAEGQSASIRLFADQGDDAADIKRLLTDTSGNFKIQHYISSAYVDSMVIDSSGNVGIGTSSPADYHLLANNLVVASAGDTGMTIVSGASSDGRIFFADGTTGSAESEGAIYYNHANNSMNFATADSFAMSIDSSGKVGIGVASPAETFHVQGSANSVKARIQNTKAGTTTGAELEMTNEDGTWQLGTGRGSLHDGADKDFHIYGNGGTKMWIESGSGGSVIIPSGAVGIGTASPNTLLHLSTTAGTQLRVTAGSANYAYLEFGDTDDEDIGRVVYSNIDNSMRFHTNAGERMRIDSSGNVGIGTDDPARNLEVYSATSNADFQLKAAAASQDARQFIRRKDNNGRAFVSFFDTDNSYNWYTGLLRGSGNNYAIGTADDFSGGGTKLVIDSSGNVGIGGTPTAPNSDYKTLEIKNTVTSGRALLALTAKSTEYSHIYFGDENDQDIGGIQYYHPNNQMYFRTNTDTRMVIDSSGKVGIGTASPDERLQVIGFNAGTDEAIITWARSDEAVGGFLGYDGNNNNVTIGSQTIHNLSFSVGGINNHKMTINTSGNVGIGVTPESWHSSYTALELKGGAALWSYNTSTEANTFLSSNAFYDGSHKYIADGEAVSYFQTSAGKHEFNVATSGSADGTISWTTAMTIDNSGNVGIGVTPDSDLSTSYSNLHIGGNTVLQSYGTQGAGGELLLMHNAVYKTNAAYKYISTDEATQYQQVSGTHKFKVAASGTADDPITWTTAMTINDTSYVDMVGASQVRLSLGSAGTAGTNTANWIRGNAGYLQYNSASSGHSWEIGGTERMRLIAGLSVGTTTSIGVGNVLVSNGIYISSSNGDYQIRGNSTGGGSATLYIGNKSIDTTASDARFKDVIGDCTNGLEVVKAFKVKDYTWKEGFDNDTTTVMSGLLAQEVETIDPSLVTKPTPKEAVEAVEEVRDADGNITTEAVEAVEAVNASDEGWSVKYQMIVPKLIQAMQEQQVTIEALEARITTLENA